MIVPVCASEKEGGDNGTQTSTGSRAISESRQGIEKK